MRTLFLVIACVSGLAAQEGEPRAPVIAPFGVQHGAASFPGRLAPGGIFVVKGAYLGPNELVTADAPYPTELAGSQLELRSDVSGEVFSVPLLHAWMFQLGGIVPLDFPPGPGQVTAIYQGRRSEPEAVMVAESAGAVFSLSQQGSGRAVAQNWESPESTPLNQFTRPARPGQTIILWATGLNNADGARKVRVALTGRSGQPSVSRWFDTTGFAFLELTPFYAGPAPGLPGVDQVNVTLPTEGLPEGCFVDVSLSVDNAGLGSTTIAIASGDGPCVHPWGLSESQLRNLDEGGQVRVASLSLVDTEFPSASSGGAEPRVLALAQTELVTADAAGGSYSSITPVFPNNIIPASRYVACGGFFAAIGGIIGGPYEPLPQPPPPDQPSREFADAGSALELLGPDGQRLSMPLQAEGGPYAPAQTYGSEDALEPGAFTPGPWTLLAPGGEDIEAFEGTIQVPPIPVVTPPERIRRGEDLQVSWDGQGFAEDVLVRVAVMVNGPAPGELPRPEGTFCYAAGSAGQVTIPKEVLAQLPASTDGFAELGVTVQSSAEFSSPALAHGSGAFQASRSMQVPID
ncbi:MAG: hypothetical protein GC160_27405 [Acidobacteria bacterium]|nr:hypothetical protein [Acidobacteriota bacterium]